MQAQQEFLPRAFSLSPVDLIPEDEEDEVDEVDERQLRYARLGQLVDKDDAKAMIMARFVESLEVDHVIDDALTDPLDADRPRIHVSDMVRLAQAFVDITRDVLDEYIGMLAATGGED